MTTPQISRIKINDIVRLLDFEEKDINAYARVVAIRGDEIRVSNMNMPFQGSLSYYLVKPGKYKRSN